MYRNKIGKEQLISNNVKEKDDKSSVDFKENGYTGTGYERNSKNQMQFGNSDSVDLLINKIVPERKSFRIKSTETMHNKLLPIYGKEMLEARKWESEGIGKKLDMKNSKLD